MEGDAVSHPGDRLYDETARRASRQVLLRYSTSFGIGTRLLGEPMRGDIAAVYGLVRIADEIVDTHGGPDAGALLDELEQQTYVALGTGYSTNLVVHAFAQTAQRTGIGREELEPFFASMRMDLSVAEHDEASYRRYVYGSAEVVGLMCLAVFVAPAPPGGIDPAVRAGALALGAAFQKINFLRDLGADHGDLGRTYLPGLDPDHPDPRVLREVLADIRGDVRRARAALPGLPTRPRIAVAVTLGLYSALLDELARTPVDVLARTRVRLGGRRKAAVGLRAGAAEALRIVRERRAGTAPGPASGAPRAPHQEAS